MLPIATSTVFVLPVLDLSEVVATNLKVTECQQITWTVQSFHTSLVANDE